jgi:hypothetical protein
MNVPVGASLTSVATLPPGSIAAAPDPYGEKRSPWPGIVKAVVIVCFLFSLANDFALIYPALEAVGVKPVPGFIRKPAALKTAIRDALATLDANKDNQVTRDEFKGSDDAFRRLDANGDGKISDADAKDSFDESPAPAAEGAKQK